MHIHTDPGDFRLFQLISPSLPIGGFTYSQGIEWAVEEGWITTSDHLHQWVMDLLESSVQNLELPVLQKLYNAWAQDNKIEIHRWNQILIASRETIELKTEELNRARAMTDLICQLHESAAAHKKLLKQSQTSCFAFACTQWNISIKKACEGFTWAWLENTVLSAIKIIPLGQTDGQRILFKVSEAIPSVINKASQISDKQIGSSTPALAIASSMHETQYTRLFRS